MVVAQQHFQEMQPWSNRLSGNTSKTIFAHSSWARYIINSGHGNWNTSKEKQALKRLEVKTTHHVNWRDVTPSQAICAQKSTDVLSIAKLHSSKLFQRMKKKKKPQYRKRSDNVPNYGPERMAVQSTQISEHKGNHFILFHFIFFSLWQWLTMIPSLRKSRIERR